MKLTAVVLTKNNETSIAAQIQNLSFADEILIIDDNSIDQTTQIAKKQGAIVFFRNLDNDFASQRNFALKKAKGDWVLFIDSDEEVSDKLSREILTRIGDTTSDGFYIRRVDNLLGKEMLHGEFGKTKLLRLGKNKAGVWRRSVHEYWDIKSAQEITNVLIHKSHASLSDFVAEINWYSTLHAKEHVKHGQSMIFLKVLLYPIVKFIQNFIVRGGYKDGVHGFVAALIMSFHSYLAWSKLWTKQY